MQLDSYLATRARSGLQPLVSGLLCFINGVWPSTFRTNEDGDEFEHVARSGTRFQLRIRSPSDRGWGFIETTHRTPSSFQKIRTRLDKLVSLNGKSTLYSLKRTNQVEPIPATAHYKKHIVRPPQTPAQYRSRGTWAGSRRSRRTLVSTYLPATSLSALCFLVLTQTPV